jgi:hypothetical protein
VARVRLHTTRTIDLGVNDPYTPVPRLKPNEEGIVTMTFTPQSGATEYMAECLFSYVTKEGRRRFTRSQPGILLGNTKPVAGALSCILLPKKKA